MRKTLTYFALTLAFTSNLAHAVDRIDLSLGTLTRPSYEVSTASSFRLGLSWDIHSITFERSPQTSIRFESSVGINKTSLGDVYDISAAPVLHYQFNKFNSKLFFELSTGAAYLSETLWAPYHDLGSHLHFADRLGLGYSFKESEISINFFHFSNGGTNNHNPGADMLLLRTSLKL